MSRLTNEIRIALRKKILHHAFDVQYQALNAEENQLAEEIYKAQYTKAELMHMEALPPGFLKESMKVTVYVGGMHIDLSLRNSHRISANREYSYDDDGKFYLDPSDKLAIKCMKYANDRKKLTERYKDSKESTGNVLNSITTLKKLIEVWPEVEVWVTPFMEGQKPVTALALPIASLNRILDLPPEK